MPRISFSILVVLTTFSFSCQPAGESQKQTPKRVSVAKPATAEPEAKLSKTQVPDAKKSGDAGPLSTDGKASSKVPDAVVVEEPIPKADGDLLFSDEDVKKLSYIKVYNYNGPMAVTPFVYADLTTGEIAAFADPGKIMRRKARLTADELLKIRAALGAIKVSVPAESDCNDNTKFGPGFRADIKIDGVAKLLATYSFHNCVKEKSDYVLADALIQLKGPGLRVPLSASATEIVDGEN